ncbi:hypothetical protein C8R45DRAFT_23002 [Mycena sanguinolenta]|nr:hypothetical protein C8R45DRAFT_23002 [Mycena sanguinolenta]
MTYSNLSVFGDYLLDSMYLRRPMFLDPCPPRPWNLLHDLLMNPTSAGFYGGYRPSTSRSDDESLQEIYPQRPQHNYETPGSESSIDRGSSRDNTYGSLREIYPRRPRQEYGMPGSGFPSRPVSIVPEPSTAPGYKSSDSSDSSDFALRPVSPELSPLVDVSRPAVRSANSQRTQAMSQSPRYSQPSRHSTPGPSRSGMGDRIPVPMSTPTATYFPPNASAPSRMQAVSPLNPGMPSNPDSYGGSYRSREASSSSSRYLGQDNTYSRHQSTFRNVPEIPLVDPRRIMDIRAPASGFPQVPSAAPNWASPVLLPETGEPHDGPSEFKRFVCDICSKSFSQKVNMQTHRHTHTGETPHRCKYNCGESFGDPAKRTRHYKDPQSSCFQRRHGRE